MGARNRVWNCRPENAGYVRKFLALASSRGIRVYWVIPPVSPTAQERRFQNGQEAAYSRFVASIQAEYPGLTVIDGRRLDLDTSSFFDPVHLNGRGAATLSGEVAKVLGATTPGGGEAPSLVRLGPVEIRR